MKITEQEMVDAIYKEMANKKPILGCVVMIFGHKRRVIVNEYPQKAIHVTRYLESNCFTEDEYEIIGHPVLLGDVLYYLEGNGGLFMSVRNELDRIWYDKRLPIEKQSLECITYVYNLLPGNTNQK